MTSRQLHPASSRYSRPVYSKQRRLKKSSCPSAPATQIIKGTESAISRYKPASSVMAISPSCMSPSAMACPPADYNLPRMDTLARIKDMAAREFSIDPKGLDPAAPLDTIGVDSLSFFEFMFKIEEEFGVNVSDEDLKSIKTLADLERHVAAALVAAGKA